MEHRPDRVSKKDCLVMRGDFFGAGKGGDGFGKDTYEQMRCKSQLFEMPRNEKLFRYKKESTKTRVLNEKSQQNVV